MHQTEFGDIFRFYTVDQLKVKCGTIKLREKSDRRLKLIIHHPLADETKLTNNIALLFLEKDYDLVENEINVVCLPTSSSSTEFDPSTCIGTGAGHTISRFEKTKYF